MDPPSHKKKPEGHAQKPRPSPGELLSSAKVVADAAKASRRHEADRVDKGRVAGAAADLLGGAANYGELEKKRLGKYVGKAEGYLREYHTSHPAHTTADASAHSSASAAGHSSAPHSGGGAHSAAAAGAGGGGYGKYVNIAQGLLNAHSGGGGRAGADGQTSGAHSGGGGGAGADGQTSGGGGYGKYIKLAEGLLKKH